MVGNLGRGLACPAGDLLMSMGGTRIRCGSRCLDVSRAFFSGRLAPPVVLGGFGVVGGYVGNLWGRRQGVGQQRGERQRFSSAILPAWACKTPKIGEVLPLLYLHGLSTGDFVPALSQFLGSAKGLSSSTVSKLTETWNQSLAHSRTGSVASGLRVPVGRRDSRQRPARGGQAVPAGDDRGACRWPRRTRRADRWLPRVDRVVGGSVARLQTPRHAGPVLSAGDGALGFWGALREGFPEMREQRCWFHKLSNVLAALPKSADPSARKALAEIWNAEDKRRALRR